MENAARGRRRTPAARELPDVAVPRAGGVRPRRVRWWHARARGSGRRRRGRRGSRSRSGSTRRGSRLTRWSTRCSVGRSGRRDTRVSSTASRASSGVYPLLAGAPLAAFGPGPGLVVLKGLQALLVAVPVVDGLPLDALADAGRLGARRRGDDRCAAGVRLHGAVMTEVTFLAVVTLLLWRLWRALLDPSLRNQALVLVLTVRRGRDPPQGVRSLCRRSSSPSGDGLVLSVTPPAATVSSPLGGRSSRVGLVALGRGRRDRAARPAFGPYGGALGRRLPPLRASCTGSPTRPATSSCS